eukprot:5073838-Karenia_brevis.AAC.1
MYGPSGGGSAFQVPLSATGVQLLPAAIGEQSFEPWVSGRSRSKKHRGPRQVLSPSQSLGATCANQDGKVRRLSSLGRHSCKLAGQSNDGACESSSTRTSVKGVRCGPARRSANVGFWEQRDFRGCEEDCSASADA